MHLAGVIFLSAAAGLAVTSDDPADYDLSISKNRGKLACEILVCIWIVFLTIQELLQGRRYVLNSSNIYEDLRFKVNQRLLNEIIEICVKGPHPL